MGPQGFTQKATAPVSSHRVLQGSIAQGGISHGSIPKDAIRYSGAASATATQWGEPLRGAELGPHLRDERARAVFLEIGHPTRHPLPGHLPRCQPDILQQLRRLDLFPYALDGQ